MNMHLKSSFKILLSLLVFTAGLAQAATTDIADTPLTQAGANAVRPNLMFVLDDSGSMGNNFMPDNVVAGNQCRLANGDTSCGNGEPPFYSAQYNGAYYDPSIRYEPAINPCDTSNNLPEMNSANTNGFTTVRDDGLAINSATCAQTSGTTNILTGYPEMIYCNTTAPTSPALNDANCRRNGINQLVAGAAGAGGFNYTSAQVLGDYDFPDNVSSTTVAVPWYSTAAPFTSGTFRIPRVVNGSNPHYYTITPREHCTDSSLVTCTLSTTPTGIFVVPALVRYCRSSAIASSNALVSDTAGTALGTTATTGAQCNSKYIGPYDFVRYGTFTRTDIVSTNNSYPRASSRDDCVGATCTYQEEMTNFANWRAYYSNRIKFMKSGAGHAFATIGDSYKVGFITINPGNPVATAEYLRIANFDTTQKSNWYKKLYSQSVGNSTPLREALARVGRYYGNRTIAGIPSGDDPQPEKYSCQQNFTLLTTDGYWNGNAGVQLDGATAIGNEDNTESTYIKRAEGSLQPGTSSGSLADVAAYYYKNDLRTDITDQSTAVAALNTKDPAPHQHMTTFTLGLGLDGSLSYTSDYETATTGDFVDIKNGTKNWPTAVNDDPTALDDLWHAAVNGHGTYFSAKNPAQLTDGVLSALAGIEERKAAGGAAAVSAANITSTDNFIFSTTYRTKVWTGELIAKTIDPNTNVISADLWSAQSKLETVAASSRSIYTFNRAANNRKNFTWLSGLDATEQSYFSNKCVNLSQCNLLTTAAKAIANDGQQMVNYLRGDTTNEGTKAQNDKAFLDREKRLGDIVSGGATLVKAPKFSYTDSGYSAFKSANLSRQPVVYSASNDGMLHAFNVNNGAELWAYVPHAVMPNMIRLADKSYGNNHRYFVDGKPTISDVFVGGVWRTLLVGGFNAGGRGYYAIDVTNPTNPIPLWEICGEDPLGTNRLCNISDADMGFSYGSPIFFKHPSNGAWTVAVTSGYNNVSPGDGKGYLYFINPLTGTITSKISTGVGSTSTISGVCATAPCPSGFGKIAAFAKDGPRDATALKLYGGDLFGNLFAFDLANGNAMYTLATFTGPNGRQPISTRPVTGLVKGVTDPIVFVGTGIFLGTTDISNADTQSLYAIRDKGSSYGNPRSVLIQRFITKSGNSASITSTGDVNWATGGWFIDLLPTSDKERVNIDPQLVLGTLIVASNQPGNAACSAGGTSWLYQFNFNDGLSVIGNGVVGSYNDKALTVGISPYIDANGELRILTTDANGETVVKDGSTAADPRNGVRAGYREITNAK